MVAKLPKICFANDARFNFRWRVIKGFQKWLISQLSTKWLSKPFYTLSFCWRDMLAWNYQSMNLARVYMLWFVGSWLSRFVGPTPSDRCELSVYFHIRFYELWLTWRLFLRMWARLDKNLTLQQIFWIGPMFIFTNRLWSGVKIHIRFALRYCRAKKSDRQIVVCKPALKFSKPHFRGFAEGKENIVIQKE